jgi:glycosyltransferase involved in cell wall biosynthesis
MKIIVLSENVSLRMGGESLTPYYYIRQLLNRGVDIQIVTHARVRKEIEDLYADDEEALDRFHFIPYSTEQRWFWRMYNVLPAKMTGQGLISSQISHLLSMRKARAILQDLTAQGYELIWQPIPISPRFLSVRFNLGIPEVLGPLAGGMFFPPGFQFMESRFVQVRQAIGRAIASPVHYLSPGKLRAEALIVANERAEQALPAGVRGRIYTGITDGGVDLDEWCLKEEQEHAGPVRFIFVGRFVPLKGVLYLVQAFIEILDQVDAVLELVGDGEMRPQIEAAVQRAQAGSRIIFHGWQSRQGTRELVCSSDVFVLPSVHDCGGHVILEAMAVGKPIITVDWGGPGEYVTDECGILLEPGTPETLVADLGKAMLRIARDQELRQRMGKAGFRRVQAGCYDWGTKTDKILKILQEVHGHWCSQAEKNS